MSFILYFLAKYSAYCGDQRVDQLEDERVNVLEGEDDTEPASAGLRGSKSPAPRPLCLWCVERGRAYIFGRVLQDLNEIAPDFEKKRRCIYLDNGLEMCG